MQSKSVGTCTLCGDVCGGITTAEGTFCNSQPDLGATAHSSFGLCDCGVEHAAAPDDKEDGDDLAAADVAGAYILAVKTAVEEAAWKRHVALVQLEQKRLLERVRGSGHSWLKRPWHVKLGHLRVERGKTETVLTVERKGVNYSLSLHVDLSDARSLLSASTTVSRWCSADRIAGEAFETEFLRVLAEVHTDLRHALEEEADLDAPLHQRTNAGDLQRTALAQLEAGEDLVVSLPFLGRPGYIRKGMSHLLSGWPKAGKTVLVVQVVIEFTGERILWLTEEDPETIWKPRLAKLPAGSFDHVSLIYARGMPVEAILAEMRSGSDTVVVVDTLRNLLGLQDESDNAEVARAVTPFVATAHGQGQTLIMVHHDRKSGGDYGLGVSGGNALVGAFDMVLDVTRDSHKATRRIVSPYGRLEVPEPLLYEKLPDGPLVAIGSPKDVGLDAVKAAVLKVVTNYWQTTAQILAKMADPKPSRDQVNKALKSLALGLEVAGEDLTWNPTIERDPPIDVKVVTGKTVTWRLPTT
jgi:hypothetical protein